jgi:hypothetical protein
MIAAARYPSRDDGRPALTRSNLPSGSGNGRAASDSGQLNDRRYLGHTALPRPLKKKLVYWTSPLAGPVQLADSGAVSFNSATHMPAGRPSIRRCFA